MTNTKFRKRALLSSVAMLLVALVALGSATFAWFVDDPNADAKGITAQANTAIGLVAKTDTDSTFSHHPKLYKSSTSTDWADSILVPATTKNGTDYFTAKAADDSASDILTSAAAAQRDPAETSTWSEVDVADSAVTSGGVYTETVTLKATGSDATHVYLNKVVVDTTSNAMADAITVLVMKGSTILGEWNKNSTGHTSITKWNTISKDGDIVAADGTAVTAKASGANLGTTIDLGSLSNGSTMDVEVYVYLNGADSSVYTQAASTSQLLRGVELYFNAVK